MPAPARLLYSASPAFAVNLKAAETECEAVLILSAKFGVLPLDRWLEPYDMSLASLSESQAQGWARRVLERLPPFQDVRVYASGRYWDLLRPYLPAAVRVGEGDLFRRAKALGGRGRVKVHYWPMNWILSEVFGAGPGGIPLASIVDSLHRRYVAATVRAQVERTVRCPLHRLKNRNVISRWFDQSHK